MARIEGDMSSKVCIGYIPKPFKSGFAHDLNYVLGPEL
jgi:hypothetical protein